MERNRGHIGTSAPTLEVPRGDYDVLHVNWIHPCGMLMQVSVKKQQPDVYRAKQRCHHTSDLSNKGFIQGISVGHFHFTLLWEQVLQFARVKLGLLQS